MAKTDESNREKFSNWLQSIQALDNTKKALHDHVLVVWIQTLRSWDKHVRAEIPTFIDCVVNDKIHVNHKKKKWESTCNHRPCATILQNLLNLQQNPGFSIVWNSNLCEKIVKVGVESKPENEGSVDNSENIPRIETSKWLLFLQRLLRPFRNLASSEEGSAEHVNYKMYEDIFEGCKKEHVWCIANMFMQRGNAKSNITSTGPDDTDAAMFFQMMKNCKLFEIENENHLYDDVLVCRNKLHHSANNRVQRAEAEANVKKMTDLLEKFENVPACKETITKIKKTQLETILSISVPDKHIRKMAKEVFKLKKSALEVDKETNKANGFSDDDTNSLLEETIDEIANTEDPEKPLNETKSRDDYKRESNEMKQRVEELEVENISLKLRAEQETKSRDDYKRESNEMKQRVEELEVENISLKLRAEQETKSRDDYKQESQEMKQRVEELEVDIKSLKLQAEWIAGSEDFENKVKNPEKHFELVTNLLQKSSNNPNVAARIVRLNPVLDRIVEDVSEDDPTFQEKAMEMANEEHIFQETNEEIDSGPNYNTGDERKDEHDSLSLLQPSATGKCKPVQGVPHPHVWSVASKHTYNIKMAEKDTCYIFGCCHLPSGDSLIVGVRKERLQKLDAEHQVVGVCNLPDIPWDVCYIGNNIAVVSLPIKLQFIDVEGMTLTSSIDTSHFCTGLACHGNKLYVTDSNTVYLYSTEGIKLCVLYTDPSPVEFWKSSYIAASDDGSRLYITFCNKLVTLDSSGNHMYTFTDPEFNGTNGVCVDGEGHVLVCDRRSDRILQFSSDGEHKLGITPIESQGMAKPIAICFDRHRSILTCTDATRKVTLLQLR